MHSICMVVHISESGKRLDFYASESRPIASLPEYLGCPGVVIGCQEVIKAVDGNPALGLDVMPAMRCAEADSERSCAPAAISRSVNAVDGCGGRTTVYIKRCTTVTSGEA